MLKHFHNKLTGHLTYNTIKVPQWYVVQEGDARMFHIVS